MRRDVRMRCDVVHGIEEWCREKKQGSQIEFKMNSTSIYTHTRTLTHRLTLSLTHTHTHLLTHSLTHTYSPTHSHTRTHTCT